MIFILRFFHRKNPRTRRPGVDSAIPQQPAFVKNGSKGPKKIKDKKKMNDLPGSKRKGKPGESKNGNSAGRLANLEKSAFTEKKSFPVFAFCRREGSLNRRLP